MNTNRLNSVVSRQRSNRARDLAFAIVIAAILAIQAVAMWQVREVAWISDAPQMEPSLSETLAPAGCVQVGDEELATLPDGTFHC